MIRHMGLQRFLITFSSPLVQIALALCALVSNSFSKPISDGTWSALTNAAAVTRQRQMSDACGWTMTWRNNSGGAIALDFQTNSSHQRAEFSIIAATGEKTPAASILMTNGVWYVKSPGWKPAKYRPYEAPFLYSFFYNLLALCKLSYVDEQRLANRAGVEVLSETNGVAELAVKSSPIVDAYLSSMRKLLTQVRELGDLKQRKETEERLERVIEAGWRCKVDIATGILLEQSSSETRLEFSNFRWTKEPAAVTDEEWRDRTIPVKGLGSDRIIMAFYRFPIPEHKDYEGYFLNVDSGEYRRIPARGGANTPGCFLADRTKVLVHVLDISKGFAHPFVIDLKTGENTPFGPTEFHERQSFSMGGSLGADGKTIAMILAPDFGSITKKRVVAVDSVSKLSRTIGPEDDYTEALWLHDGKQLAVERILPEKNGDAPLRHEIGIIDDSEKYRPIAIGDDVTVLKGDRILFMRASDLKWVTVDKDGRHVTVLPKLDDSFRTPTLSPDRNSIVVMRIGKDRLTTPFSFNLNQKELTELHWPVGAWGQPIWVR